MKRLFLLRHAKTRPAEPLQSDRERTLDARGRADAPLIGSYLRDHAAQPELVLCSPASRTRETLDLVLDAAGWQPRIAYDPDLYPGGPDIVLERIRCVENAVHGLLVIGHNPGIHRLAFDLAGSGDTEGRRRLAAKFPTAGLVVLSFSHPTWSEIGPRNGMLAAFVTPKLLAQS